MTVSKLRPCRGLALALLIFLAGISYVTAKEKDGRTVEIVVTQFKTEEERTAWMAYGIGLGGWIEKTGFAKIAPKGPLKPPFEAEVSARKTQVTIWREMNENRPRLSLKAPTAPLRMQVKKFSKAVASQFCPMF